MKLDRWTALGKESNCYSIKHNVLYMFDAIFPIA